MKIFLKEISNFQSLYKFSLIMRLTLFLLFVSSALAFSANSYAQNTKFSFRFNNASVKEVLKTIENESEFIIFYQDQQIDLERKVNIIAEDKNASEILEQLFTGTENVFTIKDRQIIIGKSQKQLDKISTPIEKVLEPVQQTAKKTIRGKVLDSKGVPLPGANVVISGTTRGVITDNDGSFQIEVATGNKLVFSFIGMISQTIEYSNQQEFNISLKDITQELEEVTVVAFGKQKKKSVIGSITTIKTEDLKIPSSNLTAALAGKVAGIISYQRSGEPGQDNAEFFIRGVTTFGYKTSPLILIDGMELSTKDLSRLQPEDIPSLSIMR